ncbi:Amphoterin-induced protein 3 [Acipenser ruthenus]|uniref:Amphoterin-induced protein 3 n=1 Tax=Acipenser ruthenus TaxID=7906 RepID=A0A444UHX5_ACIRT|nr:Amphoterin-induced protein 3 [Acipenser ruthenus]
MSSLARLLVVGLLLMQKEVEGDFSNPHGCPSSCICASDILSCVNHKLHQLPAVLPHWATTLDLSHNVLAQLGNGGFSGLPRLRTLRLAHNQLQQISEGAFWNASSLRHLDLSFNKLEVVEQHYFQELVNLEVLLLFKNSISRVDSQALAGLGNLHKVYFSLNLLTNFPFFSIQEPSHPLLNTLDISSNRLRTLPIEKVKALPANVRNGLYLHNNPLTCECSLYKMFLHWEKLGFGSVHDFREEHTCLVYGEPRAQVRFFRHVRIFENCTFGPQTEAPEDSLKAFVGEPLLFGCNASFNRAHTTYVWITPHQEFIAPPGNANKTLRMYNNGSLEIKEAQIEDSGVYVCIALNHRLLLNETREVNVTVLTRRYEEESFNTGLTTLFGCLVTLVLILMYLFLTPCRCWCRKQPTPSPANECSAQSSILTTTPPATTEGPGRKASTTKHVVFLEPIKEVQNGRLRVVLGRDHPKIQQLKSDTDSITSVLSDAPIVP